MLMEEHVVLTPENQVSKVSRIIMKMFIFQDPNTAMMKKTGRQKLNRKM